MDPSPAKRVRLSASRTSLSGSRRSLSGPSGSSLPRATGSVMQSSNRLTSSTQPTYDFIAGEPNENEQPHARSTSRPPSRQGSVPPPLKRTSLRGSMLPKPESTLNTSHQAGNHQNAAHAEEVLALRAKINSLEYELKSLQSERGVLSLQHEKETREQSAKADSEYAKFQNAEKERMKAVRAAETANKEVAEIKERVANEKAALERKVRDAQTKYEATLEEKEDIEGRFGELAREYDRFKVDEVEGKRSQLIRTLEELQAELDGYKGRFETGQRRLEERENDVERLEKRIMELNESAGGSGELEVLKRELSDQVAYVRRLEGQVREQNSELKKLREERRSVNVVEEEKRAMETEMQVLKEAEKRAGELEIQKEILEDEKRMWTSLLEREGGESERFESPEAVVKALVNERIEHALVVDRLGGVESELAGKDEVIRALESERDTLKLEAEKAGATTSEGQPSEASLDSKAYKRLDRQRQLAVKEVEYLRAQLKTFDTEETILMENTNFDGQRAEQIKHLESLVDQYKSEIQTLHTDLGKLETAPGGTSIIEPRGTKRAADHSSSSDNSKTDQMGTLLRKNKNLQSALQNTTKTSQMLAAELQATKSQLKALRQSKSTRVLELRDNPTSQHEAIKQNTLRTLKAENKDLMAQLRGNKTEQSKIKTIPVSALDALNLELQDLESQLADKDKRARRQREIWTEKAAEFRDVISSILGYKITFLPNGKVKVSSLYYRPDRAERPPSSTNQTDDPDEDSEENYILFDGEKGTMKISGGNEGRFKKEIENQIDFWVKDRKEIPMFLAGMSLEFYERYGGLNGLSK